MYNQRDLAGKGTSSQRLTIVICIGFARFLVIYTAGLIYNGPIPRKRGAPTNFSRALSISLRSVDFVFWIQRINWRYEVRRWYGQIPRLLL